jgi:hypothetical protein
MYRLEDVITAAWRLPQLQTWDPNTAPSCTVTIRPRPKPSGLILPPGMVPPAPKPEDIPTYFVTFTVDAGTVHGAPAYQIIGTCKGTSIVVHQGFMEKRSVN